MNAKTSDHQKTESFELGKKEKLLKEIETLKLVIRHVEDRMSFSKFGCIRQPDSLVEQNDLTEETEKIQNVQIDLENDLYRFAGMQCIKFEEAYIFQFSAGRKITKDKQYAVQILNVDGQGKIGKWVLPMSMDIHDILSEHPIDDLNNIKPFLKSCKHHINCYVTRKHQYNQLKNFTMDITNFRLEGNFGYTRVTIEMLEVKEKDSGEIYHLRLYLFYKTNEARPYKLIPDVMVEEKLPDTLSTKLNKYYKPFFMYDLKSAFEKIMDTHTIFIWTTKLRIDEIIKVDEITKETGDSLEKEKEVIDEHVYADTMDQSTSNVEMHDLTDHAAEHSLQMTEKEERQVSVEAKPKKRTYKKRNPRKRRKLEAHEDT